MDSPPVPLWFCARGTTNSWSDTTEYELFPDDTHREITTLNHKVLDDPVKNDARSVRK